MRLPHRLTTIAVAGCLVLTAASCSGGGEPEPAPSSESGAQTEKAAPESSEVPASAGDSPTRSTDSATKKPVRSKFPHIDDQSDSGAAASLDYFVAGYRYGLLTGDPAIIEEVSADSCQTCKALVDDIKDPSRRLSDADWSATEARVNVIDNTHVDTATNFRSKTTLKASGRTQVQTVYIGALMSWQDGKWVASAAAVEVE